MLRECCICGELYEEKYMEKRSPSPMHPKWICMACLTNLEREAKLYDIRAGNRLRKMDERRKRK